MNPSDASLNEPVFSPEDLRQELNALRNTLNLGLFSGLIMACSVSIYLLRDVILTRRQISEHLQYVGDFEKTMTDIHHSFQSFARTNADFNPIVQKYFPAKPPGTKQDTVLPGPPK
jgi:hypothetical protein